MKKLFNQILNEISLKLGFIFYFKTRQKIYLPIKNCIFYKYYITWNWIDYFHIIKNIQFTRAIIFGNTI